MTKHEKEKLEPASKGEAKADPDPSEKRSGETASAENKPVDISRAEYEELLRKAGEFRNLQDQLLRSAADFDNARKRLAKEREDFLKYVLEDLMLDLLPILDNFELALAHLPSDDEKAKPLREGFLLIQKQMLNVLTGRGLRRLEALGKAFDPHLHEAVGHIVVRDASEGIVVEEVLAGYQLNGKLIRPAKVKISAKTEQCLEEKTEELT
ncbi:MAG: nucleotide exchange factor GrpE [Candidatus Omnitrophica bacterium]|nr:nucleotide exchange factor GrpE [Candidatus Omnitrophota bacterium]